MPNSLSGSTGQNTQYLPPYGIGQPGSIEQSAGGIQALVFRDRLDAARSGMAGFVPSAEYPDGYLGTIQSRREDRLLDSLKDRVNDRSYTRGVHKGERIDADDYFWPSELQPDRGLREEAAGVQLDPRDPRVFSRRAAPLGTVQEQMIASGASELPRTPRGKMRPQASTYDQPAASGLQQFLPTWR